MTSATTRLPLTILAAAALAAPAAAQTVAPGVTWQQRAPAAMAPRQAVRPSPPVAVQRPLPPRIVNRGDNRIVGRGPHRGPRFEHGRRFPHIRRFERGFFIPPTFFGPRFHVNNFGLYGFPQPYGGQRWIRHYDDAYLVDERGRVEDYRYGMDWDRYGAPGGYADGGYPPEQDYGYAEDYPQPAYPANGGYMPSFCPPPPGPTLAPPPPCTGGGYTWVPVTITETTVTTPGKVNHYYRTTSHAAPRPYKHKRRYK